MRLTVVFSYESGALCVVGVVVFEEVRNDGLQARPALLVAGAADWLNVQRTPVVAMVVVGCYAATIEAGDAARQGRQQPAPDSGMNMAVRSCAPIFRSVLPCEAKVVTGGAETSNRVDSGCAAVDTDSERAFRHSGAFLPLCGYLAFRDNEVSCEQGDPARGRKRGNRAVQFFAREAFAALVVAERVRRAGDLGGDLSRGQAGLAELGDSLHGAKRNTASRLPQHPVTACPAKSVTVCYLWLSHFAI